MKLADRMLFVLAKLLKLVIDRTIDKTADRTVCETVMIDRAVEDKCVNCRKALTELESV